MLAYHTESMHDCAKRTPPAPLPPNLKQVIEDHLEGSMTLRFKRGGELGRQIKLSFLSFPPKQPVVLFLRQVTNKKQTRRLSFFSFFFQLGVR